MKVAAELGATLLGVPTQSVGRPDIMMWPAKEAPSTVKRAFCDILSPGAWIVKISSALAQDIVIEGWIRSHSVMPLLARVQLRDGAIALLFAPPQLR
jgi:hypothetical protein